MSEMKLEDQIRQSKIIPINKQILCKVKELEESSGVVLPENVDGNKFGKNYLCVIYIAGDCTKVKVGDLVTFGSEVALSTVTFIDDDYVMGSEDDVGVILRKE